VTIDEGYVLAQASPDPFGKRRVVAHRRREDGRFVDLTVSRIQSMARRSGEILNYWAPVMLCLWLEDGTQGLLLRRVSWAARQARIERSGEWPI
jgi:hypothetical protein